MAMHERVVMAPGQKRPKANETRRDETKEEKEEVSNG